MHPIVNIAVRAARRGANMLLRNMDHINDLEITAKGSRDLVSEVDRAAEREIIEVIQHVYPQHSILAEESGAQPGDDYEWIIDPLDGTFNYLHGIPHFCVSIGVRIKGRVEHGVVYDPVREELFSASRGEGAMLNNRRIRASRRSHMDDALLGTGFAAASEHFDAFQCIHDQFNRASTLRRSGSAALDLAYVAAGRYDGFFELALKPWDIAAGALLVREAGGMVADPDGSENYLESGNIVAGNIKLFRDLLRTVHRGLKLAKA